MKVRFDAPPELREARDCGSRGLSAPAQRPHVPRWRWVSVMLLVAILLLVGMARQLAGVACGGA